MHTSCTSLTSHTSYTSHTSQTSLIHHTSRTSHIHHTHHTTARTPSPTKPAFAIVTRPCILDTELGTLQNNAEDAQLFCPLYLGYHSPILLPTYVSHFGRSQITSACSCFDAGHNAAGSTTPPAKTEADLAVSSGAPSSSTIVSGSHSSRPSSSPSTSTAGGSVVRGNRSSSASTPWSGHFAVTLVSILVISSVTALFKGV